jgi:predicted RNase H-like HicB family nuclease
MGRYAVIFEPARTGFSAYVPDLPGCVATGGTLPETQACIQSAMEMHLSAMREEGDPIPEPSYVAEIRDVS